MDEVHDKAEPRSSERMAEDQLAQQFHERQRKKKKRKKKKKQDDDDDDDDEDEDETYYRHKTMVTTATLTQRTAPPRRYSKERIRKATNKSYFFCKNMYISFSS